MALKYGNSLDMETGKGSSTCFQGRAKAREQVRVGQADSEKEATYEHLHGNPKGSSEPKKKSLIWHIGYFGGDMGYSREKHEKRRLDMVSEICMGESNVFTDPKWSGFP